MLSPGARLRWEGPGGPRELEVRSSRPAGRRVLVKFVGWEGREKAKELCGGAVSVAREALARPSEDFLFEDEIEGFVCVSSGGETLGRARRFERHGDQVCLEVARGGRTYLVPYTRPIVVEVDRELRRVVLDPPEGLLEP
jgi:16S rRNA processing protein RimM